MTVNVIEVRKNILAVAHKKRGKEMLAAAMGLEYVSLQFSILPEDLFLIYVDVLSDPHICATPGVDGFVRGLFNDFEKLSDVQKARLLRLFVTNADVFSLPMLRFAISDFIARKYLFKIATDVFSELWACGSDYSQDMALSGVQILSMRKSLTSV